MEAENFKKVLLEESLHRSSQNNMNQAEAGYNAKWFRRGGLFAFEWLQERSYSEGDFKLFARQYYREIKLDKSNLLWDELADKCLEQFKKK